jgi:hypothetical protein
MAPITLTRHAARPHDYIPLCMRPNQVEKSEVSMRTLVGRDPAHRHAMGIASAKNGLTVPRGEVKRIRLPIVRPRELADAGDGSDGGATVAGVPVTHRGVAHEVVVSGHRPPGHPDSRVDWTAIGRLQGTVVLLTAVATFPDIARALVDAGSRRTPRS